MDTHIKIVGFMMVCIASMHIAFPKYFKWKNDFKNCAPFNRQMMYIHTLFIALTVLLMGLLCLFSSTELLTTPLGKKVLWGFLVFWGVRFVLQFLGYSADLWKGKRFETAMHILFSFVWAYFVGVFVLSLID